MTDWGAIEDNFDITLVEAVRQRLASGSSPQVDPDQFVSGQHSKNTVLQLFEALIQAGVLRQKTVLLCPQCDHALQPDDVKNGTCPNCNFDFYESDTSPTGTNIYLTHAETSREVPWLVAIHGFNTQGEWQEEFSWLLATRFRHRAPVLIHKFPILRYGVLFKLRHRQLVELLDLKLRHASDRAKSSGIESPPDIVAHSFGSLLFAKLLGRKDSKDLRFGRVILTGSIVRPDYDWKKHIEAGRIEIVLNHCSEGDRVVDWAQYAIPDSGPSGRAGFDDKLTLNHRETEFGHGTHFEPDIVIKSLEAGGIWDRFLRLPKSTIFDAINDYRPPKAWKPISYLFRKATWLFLAFIPAVLVGIIIGVLWLVCARL